jgi:hypothetical protein
VHLVNPTVFFVQGYQDFAAQSGFDPEYVEKTCFPLSGSGSIRINNIQNASTAIPWNRPVVPDSGTGADIVVWRERKRDGWAGWQHFGR